MKPIPKYIALLLLIIGFYACASTGTPDGGPYDEEPPKFVRANPVPNSTGNKEKKVTIEFDEFIKLENASEKVIISPPQNEAPEVKTSGKKVIVSFMDTLRANTTYTIDFGDAIVDNNEGNPMGQFTYAFSTGNAIDTMEVSGTVLNAENLEPIKGIQVGLHKNLNDTAFTTLPFERISRTDSRGQFTIRGIAPGKYRIFALMDGNQNYLFDSKTESVAWLDSLIVPSMEGAVRQDTVWNKLDTTKIDTIMDIHYTRFMPDNIMLRAFKEDNPQQYLLKSERPQLYQFCLYFNAKADTLPTLTGLDFDEKKLLIEHNQRNDSIVYWINDTTLCERDTLTFQLDYLITDSIGKLVPQRDTLTMLNKIPKERRLAMKEEEAKKKEKERKKAEKKGDEEQKAMAEEVKFLPINVDAPSELDLNRNIVITFEEPLEKIDTSAIHMSHMVDSTWTDVPFIFRTDTITPRRYEILADWRPGEEYKLNIDSLGFKGIYGLSTDKVEKTLKVKTLDAYGTLYLNIVGAGPHAIVQLLNGNDEVVRQQPVTDKQTCDFYFLQPSTKYYIRLFNDTNNNGKWDTGDYNKKIQPEEVFYFPKVWEMKANFEFEETWNLHAVPLDKQKLDDIKKQKPDETKKIKDRNKERAKKLGRA